MQNERILIAVKTYPTLSTKYGETVCTAGVREDGSWVRIYPVPFRHLDQSEQYHLFDWIECPLKRNPSDPRPETFRPTDLNLIRPIRHVDTARNWEERRHIFLNTCDVHSSLATIKQGAKDNQISLTVFKPKKILGFKWEHDTREWDPKKLQQMKSMYNQLDLFDDNEWRKTFEVIPKLPYNFSYVFEDTDGTKSELQILEWQIGALYWNCLRNSSGDEDEALAKVKQKYFDQFINTDLHFFLGTTQQFHFIAPNPWVIIGVFPIPFEPQSQLFDL